MVGQGCGVRRLVAGVIVIGRHGSFLSSDRPRPSRPSWRRKAAGGPDLHRRAKRQRRKRSGGWRRPAILFRDVKRPAACRRRKIAGRRHCRAGPFAARSPSQKAVSAALSDTRKAHDRDRTEPAPRAPVSPFRRRRQSSMKRATSSGASCTRKAARSASMPNRRKIIVEVVAMRRQRDRIDPGRSCAVEQSGHRAIPGGIVVADDIQPT